MRLATGLATLLLAAGVHSAAAATATLAYVTNYASNTVSVINTATNTVTDTIAVGASPAGVAMRPGGAFVYVANSGSGTVSVIDTTLGLAVATIPVGTAPVGVVITPNGQFVYVTNSGSGTVSVIATATNTVIATIPGFSFATIAGEAPPAGLGMSPDGAFVYVPQTGSGALRVLTAIATTTNTIAWTAASTWPNEGWMAVTPDGRYGYQTGYFGYITKIDLATRSEVSYFSVTGGASGPGLEQIILAPDAQTAYVASLGFNRVYVLNLTTNSVTGTYNVGTAPFGLALGAGGTSLYVANTGGTTVSVINTTTGTQSAIPVGSRPFAIAIGAVTPFPATIHVEPQSYTAAYTVDGTTYTGSQTVSLERGVPHIVANPSGSSFTFGVTNAGTVASISNNTAAFSSGDTLYLRNTTIDVDPQGYSGQYYLPGHPHTIGPASFVVIPGLSLQFDNYSGARFGFDVDPSGTISGLTNTVAASALGNVLRLNTRTVMIDPQSYVGQYFVLGNHHYIGLSTFELIAGLDFLFDNYSGARFAFRLDASGNVTGISNAVAAQAVGNVLVLNNAIVHVDPQRYTGLYYIWGNPQATGQHDYVLIPGLGVLFDNYSGDTFAFDVAADGGVSHITKPLAATGGVHTLLVNNACLTINPGAYAGVYAVQGHSAVSGIANVQLIPGLRVVIVGAESTPFLVNTDGSATPATVSTVLGGQGVTFTLAPGVCTIPTLLDDVGGTGTFGATATVHARVTAEGAPLAGLTVSFTVNSGNVGSAVTDISGVATLTLVSLAGINAGTYPGGVQAAFVAAANYAGSTAGGPLMVDRATPVLTWPNPAPITYPAALGAAELNATANVPGTFVYTPAAGTVLLSGTRTLSVVFTPDDTTNYTGATTSVSIIVGSRNAVLVWPTPAPIVYGTPLSVLQLNATADVPGTFSYVPQLGTVLAAGIHTLTGSFQPDDAVNYIGGSVSVQLIVLRATPVLNWPTPAPITYPAALTSTQLNASANVAGTFAYTPGAGTVLSAGNGQALRADFTPSDENNFNLASTTALIDVRPPVVVNQPPVAHGTAVTVTVRPSHADDEDDRRDHDEYFRRRDGGRAWTDRAHHDDDDEDRSWERNADESRATRVTLTATDADNTVLSFRIVTPPAHGILSRVRRTTCEAAGGGSTCAARVIYVPEPHYLGPDSFTYVANDGVQDSNVATVTINLVPPFTTFTQGALGSTPQGDNPGAVLANNFATLYAAAGVTVGGIKQLRFTSAAAIRTFLPAGGKAGPLPSNAAPLTVNPPSSKAGVLAGHVLALRINVDLSAAGVTRSGLGALALARGEMRGTTVQQLLNIANAVLGGDVSALPPRVTVADLSEIVARVNTNFGRGREDNGYVTP